MDLSTLKAFEENTRAVVPGFRVAWKTDSTTQKLLGRLLWFNPRYMTEYVSTFYPVVYYPSKENYETKPLNSLAVIAHERVHLLDTAKSGFWFRFSYLLPQILLVPLLLSSILCLFFAWKLSIALLVIGLLSVIPWPSLWRTHWEKRGYTMSMAVFYWVNGEVHDGLKKPIRDNFLGMSYFKMSWSPKDIDQWITKTVSDIESGALGKDPIYGAVYQFLLDQGLVKQ